MLTYLQYQRGQPMILCAYRSFAPQEGCGQKLELKNQGSIRQDLPDLPDFVSTPRTGAEKRHSLQQGKNQTSDTVLGLL